MLNSRIDQMAHVGAVLRCLQLQDLKLDDFIEVHECSLNPKSDDLDSMEDHLEVQIVFQDARKPPSTRPERPRTAD
jgi:hypothetical protein